MVEFTLWDIVRNLLLAARWTVYLSLIAFFGGGLLGLVVCVGRISATPAVAWAARVYIEALQGTPLLMQLFLCFFGLALLGIHVPPLIAAAVALTFYTSAFLGEIWRGCVQAIPKGQWEASASLAFTYGEQLRYVVLPQALRIAIAPTVGFLVQVIKGTALASIIGFVELTKAGTMINNATFRSFLVYGLVGLFYFALCYPLSLLSQRLERRMGRGRSNLAPA
jgi:polar amino acid transport system permease protein